MTEEYMKKLLINLIMLLFVGLSFGSQIFAEGFQINQQGAKAMGMGGAFIAQANDPSAIFFNPAGLGFQKGMKVMVGTTLLFPSTNFTSPAPYSKITKMKSQIFYPSNFYGTYGMDNGFVLGLGVFKPFGFGTEWDKDWGGNYLAVKTDLQTVFINPTISFKVNEQLSIALGVSYVSADVKIPFYVPTDRHLDSPSSPNFYRTGELDASGSGVNINFGYLLKPSENLSVGLSYRHKTKLDFKGKAKITELPSEYDGETTITLPSNISAAIAYVVIPELTVEGGFQYVMWESYRTLDLNIKNLALIKRAKDWENVFLFRLGGEYRYKQFAFRAGYVYDKTPQPDKSVEPMLPDANRNTFAFGVGYKLTDALNLDFAYQYVMFADRTVTSPTNFFPGTYKSASNLFGISVSHQF